MKDQSTPRPWHHTRTSCSQLNCNSIWINADGLDSPPAISIGETQLEAEENANLIVKAVNCHDELVKALKEITERYERLEIIYAKTIQSNFDCENGTIKRAKQALSKSQESKGGI